MTASECLTHLLSPPAFTKRVPSSSSLQPDIVTHTILSPCPKYHPRRTLNKYHPRHPAHPRRDITLATPPTLLAETPPSSLSPHHPRLAPHHPRLASTILDEGFCPVWRAIVATSYGPLYSKTLSMTVPSDYSDLPNEWISNLPPFKYLTAPTPVPATNKFHVLCGQSIEEWEAAGWINYNFDPRGWFQWYTRFYHGRRCDDDNRQIGRWKRCVGPTGRWKRILLKRYKEKGIRDTNRDEAGDVSPVVHQTCHHVLFLWGLN